MKQVTELLSATEYCLWNVNKGEDVMEQLNVLRPLFAQLAAHFKAQATEIYALRSNSTLQKAWKTHAQKAEIKRNEQMFQLQWRDGECTYLKGWYPLAKRLGLAESSIRTKLSLGGESFSVERKNALLGNELDILTITRLPLPEADGPTRRKMGRPRTRPYTEQEIERARENGTQLAPPARPVPKRTNRDTDPSR